MHGPFRGFSRPKAFSDTRERRSLALLCSPLCVSISLYSLLQPGLLHIASGTSYQAVPASDRGIRRLVARLLCRSQSATRGPHYDALPWV
ncbi:hypothetical protein BDW72DRAFT_173416 [Aspergillus terricola var. indicus]